MAMVFQPHARDIGDSMILLKQFKNTVFISWDEMEVVS